MVCHALGRCRICARKHKLPIFGSEENQHALMEKVHLRLIVLNTVCIDCIGKFEQYLKETDLRTTFEKSTSHHKQTDSYKPPHVTPTGQHANIEARPTMQFYVETDDTYTAKIQVSCENERLKQRKDCDIADGDNMMQHTQNHQINDAAEVRSFTVRTKGRTKTASKIQDKRKSRFHLCCDFCSKEFTHRGDLKRHKRMHTGEKPYECPECHKMFSQLSNLTRHRLVHSGERPFSCNECGQSYSRKGRLANHIGRELCRRKRRLPARFSQTLAG